MYEITIDKIFAASHALTLPDASLEPLHGHNWSVTVTVGSNQLDALQTVMDFHDLERLVEQTIAPWRNRHLNDLPPFNGEPALAGGSPSAGGSLATVKSGASEADEPFINPSAERVAWAVAERVAEHLPPHVHLVSVRVGEAPHCTATYRPPSRS